MATTGAAAEVVRRINFYRVDVGADEAGRAIPFNPVPGLTHINRLTFSQLIWSREEYFVPPRSPP